MNWTCKCGATFDNGGGLLGHVREGCDQQPEAPTDFDREPSPHVLARLPHIHIAGRCVKNRNGARCQDARCQDNPMAGRS